MTLFNAFGHGFIITSHVSFPFDSAYIVQNKQIDIIFSNFLTNIIKFSLRS
jgi:hypothetical protein